MKYERNMKYVKGYPNTDNWQEINETVAKGLLEHLRDYATQRGYDVESYMRFVKTAVIREIAEK